MIKEYILQNWALLLLLTAFVIMLKTTVFLEQKVVKRMLILIAAIFLLSVSVFAEFWSSIYTRLDKGKSCGSF